LAAPVPKSIFTTGSPRLPVQSWANKFELVIPVKKNRIKTDLKQELLFENTRKCNPI